MASHISTLAENNTLDIKLNDSEYLSRVLHLKLQEAPEPWMMIQGSHSITNLETSHREQVIDFAVKIKGLNARLLLVELRGDEGDDLEVISVVKRDENLSVLDEEVIQRSCQTVVRLANKGYYKRITVETCTLDIDHTTLQKTLRGVANLVVYGGNINFALHDTTSLTTYQDQSLQKEGKAIHIKAIWTFD
ncbi:hypothetical protein EAE96_007087 [Botrytis aclada]|nr:hypothetical protein EAE96_007087 [Botrytis aclada]